MKILTKLIFALIALASVPWAGAATVRYAVSSAGSDTNGYTEPVTETPAYWTDGQRVFSKTELDWTSQLPQFDPSLGTLTGVQVEFYGASYGTITLTLGNAPQRSNAKGTTLIDVTANIGANDVSLSDSLTTGLKPLAPNSSTIFGPYKSEWTPTVLNPTNFAPYIGTGTIPVAASTTTAIEIMGGSGFGGGSQTTSVWAGAIITYTYDPAPPVYRISGTVYQDQDANSVIGATDPRIVGVTITLACTNPARNATTTTAADGSYAFSGIAAGSNCTVTETQPAGYLDAATNPGTGGTSTATNVITFTNLQADSPNNNFGEVLPTDTTATLTCTPNPAAAGTPVACTATCTNAGSNPALAATCQFTGTLPPGVTSNSCATPATSASLAPGAALSCTLQFPAPATPLALSAGSGAGNDSNGGADPSAGNNPATAKLTPAPAPATPVPTLGEWALALMALLLGAAAMAPLRRNARG